MDNKKRMMFIYSEDFNYLTYRVLLILKFLDCIKKPLIDHRKLGYIIEILSYEENIRLISKAMIGDKSLFSQEDNEKLLKIFYNGKLNEKNISKLLFALEKNDFVSLAKNEKFSCIDVYIKDLTIIQYLLNDDLFEKDSNEILKIKGHFPTIRRIKFETFIGKLFDNTEVSIWEGL